MRVLLEGVNEKRARSNQGNTVGIPHSGDIGSQKEKKDVTNCSGTTHTNV